MYRFDYLVARSKFALVEQNEDRRYEFGSLLEALSFASQVTHGFVPLFEVNESGNVTEVGAIAVGRKCD